MSTPRLPSAWGSDGALTADEVLQRYCALVYAQTGSYLETAQRLQLDRRTVKLKVDPALLAALRADAAMAGDRRRPPRAPGRRGA